MKIKIERCSNEVNVAREIQRKKEIYAHSRRCRYTQARHNKAKEFNAKLVCVKCVCICTNESAYAVPTMPYISSTNYAKNFTAFAFSTELIIYVMYVNRFLSIPFCSVGVFFSHSFLKRVNLENQVLSILYLKETNKTKITQSLFDSSKGRFWTEKGPKWINKWMRM